ncbi:CRISPR-associated protein Cas4 [Fretibacterium sp. OH1220_COT-178]|uniref:CRISPR-associated protein Cas4 n=1 Tax=Fretibacterium sp. OH1220_COT-178 TaxID=2491047 RepID=UPI000F5DA234|nr:CRISPR-associated protein Cas4 [Fretibacterium sp. OH1220_COT-178]RRD63468.1 CRISPR-associated protein Cas4 [Fretibacterium sp. OH1220_COT-178]
MFSELVKVNGYLVQAFSICRRQVWLLARGVTAEQSNESLALGRLVDQNSYARERHQVGFGDNKFDFVQGADGELVVCEVKKSSRAERSARLQLAHYLYDLQKAGIEARGVLMFPTEKKRVEVELTDALKAELDCVYAEIESLAQRNVPPPAEHCKYCGKCAYAEYCWG